MIAVNNKKIETTRDLQQATTGSIGRGNQIITTVIGG